MKEDWRFRLKKLLIDLEMGKIQPEAIDDFVESLLKQRDKEIIKLIDEMIEKHGLEGDLYHQALTELKQFIEEKI